MQSIDEAAAFWMVRLTSSDVTPQERHAFENWLAQDPSHQSAYDRMRRGASFVDRHISDIAVTELVEAARAETLPAGNGTIMRRWRIFGAVAASLIVIVAGLTAGLLAPQRISPDDTPFDVTAMLDAYETAVGQRSSISLTDGSTVTLNTDSSIMVNYEDNARIIHLLRGQAIFEVEKDVDRPFIVTAGEKRIVALGTAFDVRMDDIVGIEVLLMEGRVSVDNVGDSSAGPLSALVPGASGVVELKPGERFSLRVDAPARVQSANISQATSWRSGRLVFDDLPLAEAIAEMNRYSAQKLVTSADPRVLELRVSGSFKTGRASTFVHALEVMHPLAVKRSARNELTLVWRE